MGGGEPGDAGAVSEDTPPLTAPGGALDASDEDRRAVAVYADGRVYVNRMRRGDPAIYELCDRAEDEFGVVLRAPSLCPPEEVARRNVGDARPAGGAAREAGAEYQAQFRQLLARAAAVKASDIDIKLTDGVAEVRFRINNDRTPPLLEMPEERARALFYVALHACDRGPLIARQDDHQAGSIFDRAKLPDVLMGVRMQSTVQPRGYELNLRLHYTDAVLSASSLESIGLHPRVIDQLRYAMLSRAGLLTMGAPTESGKTTTLRVILKEEHDRTPGVKIVSADDPPEEQEPWMGYADVRSDANLDGWQQIAALIVRVNPDIVRFGETRDAEVLRQAIAQAFAGKLVVTTTHATNAQVIPQRFLQLPGSPPISADMIFAPDLHKGFMSQRLPALLCDCAIPLAAVPAGAIPAIDTLRGRLEATLGDHAAGVRVRNIEGCRICAPDPGCASPGHRGRTLIGEFILPDQRFLALTRAQDTEAARAHWLGELEGYPMTVQALELLLAGRIDPTVFLAAVQDLKAAVRDHAVVAGGLAGAPRGAPKTVSAGVAVNTTVTSAPIPSVAVAGDPVTSAPAANVPATNDPEASVPATKTPAKPSGRARSAGGRGARADRAARASAQAEVPR